MLPAKGIKTPSSVANMALTLFSLEGIQDKLCYQGHAHQIYQQQMSYKETKKLLTTLTSYLVVTGAFYVICVLLLVP